jgi:hypothetical protein
LGGGLHQDLVRNLQELLDPEGLQNKVLPAVLEALDMAMIACHKDRPTSLIARDFGEGETVSVSGLRDVDDDDVVIVVIECRAHLGASPDG